MTRQKQHLRPTKKHLARAERERILQNRIIAGTVITTILVIGLVAYSFYHQLVVVPNEPVAVVDGEKITTRDFQSRVLFELQSGNTPQDIAPSVLDTMINGVLVRHEAKAMGIEIPQTELDQTIEEAFGYYREGTPTSAPSPTVDPTQFAQRTLTAAATAEATNLDATPTNAITPTPRPTPTPYTQEGFDEVYSTFLSSVDEQTGLSEAQFRRLVETNLLREKIREIIGQDVSMNGEKTELRHILTDSQETAQEVRSKLDEGEAWEDLVLEYSQDATTKEDGGDLGWLTEEIILAGFGASAQSLATEPVGTLIGPVQTYQGWDVFEIMGREVQPYTDYEYQLAKNAAFDQWLLEVRGNAEIDVAEDWYTRIPEIDVSQTGY